MMIPRKSKRKNRTRIEIAYRVLEVCKKAKGTHKIMSGARLSHDLFKNYIRLLESAGLLKRVQGGRWSLYRTTEEGENFLMAFREVGRLESKCRELEESLNRTFSISVPQRSDVT